MQHCRETLTITSWQKFYSLSGKNFFRSEIYNELISYRKALLEGTIAVLLTKVSKTSLLTRASLPVARFVYSLYLSGYHHWHHQLNQILLNLPPRESIMHLQHLFSLITLMSFFQNKLQKNPTIF